MIEYREMMTKLVMAHFEDDGLDETLVKRTYTAFPVLVSHDVAEIDVVVVMQDGTLHQATVSTKVQFVDPMHVLIEADGRKEKPVSTRDDG